MDCVERANTKMNNTVCLHCWHSDFGQSRWYCCRCADKCGRNYLDVRRCYFCGLRTIPDEYGSCPICEQFIRQWCEKSVYSNSFTKEIGGVIVDYAYIKRWHNFIEVKKRFDDLFTPAKVENFQGSIAPNVHCRTTDRSKGQRKKQAAGSWDKHSRNRGRGVRSKWARERLRDIPIKDHGEAFWNLFTGSK